MGRRKSDLRNSDVADGCKGLSAVTMRQVAEADCVVTGPKLFSMVAKFELVSRSTSC